MGLMLLRKKDGSFVRTWYAKVLVNGRRPKPRTGDAAQGEDPPGRVLGLLAEACRLRSVRGVQGGGEEGAGRVECAGEGDRHEVAQGGGGARHETDAHLRPRRGERKAAQVQARR